MARKSAYLRQRKSKNLRFLLFILIIIGACIALYTYSSNAMDKEIKHIDSEITSNQKKLKGIDEEITKLTNDYNIRNTDEFKEQIAEDMLGMTKENEQDSNENIGEDLEESENHVENNDVSEENIEESTQNSNDSKETIDNIEESSEESSEGSN